MGVAAMFGIFAGTYFWFPKMTGRMMNETLGKIHFWLSFVGAYCIFMPFHYLGMAGNVRRYSAFVVDYLQPLIPVHGSSPLPLSSPALAQLIFVYNLIHSRFWGKPAPDNPWEATSLEWSTPTTPPPFNNFGGKHSGGLSRSLPVRGEEFDWRLRNAGFAGASCNRERREVINRIRAVEGDSGRYGNYDS